jgi:anthranilate phosphoribosyltransferase
MILRELLRVLGSSRRDGRNLTTQEAYRAFSSIFEGTESEIQVGAFLIALRWKGTTVEELKGFARAARDKARIPCMGMEGVVAICPPHDGTDDVPPLEVAASLVAAGAGTRVLIISDRCVPPRRGLTAASVLEHLGVGMTWDPTEAEDWVAKARFGAIAAAGMLPAMLGLRRVRRDVGVRTPLSTVEKLLAPPSATVVLAAQTGPVLGTAVEVIQELGHTRGVAIQGRDGGIVPTLRKRSRGIQLNEGHQVPLTVEPSDFGLAASCDPELPMFGPPQEGQGSGDNPALIAACGELTASTLQGEPGPARNATLLGAAVILKASGRALTLAEGVDIATESLDSGAALGVIERLRTLTSP